MTNEYAEALHALRLFTNYGQRPTNEPAASMWDEATRISERLWAETERTAQPQEAPK